jgi:hypothetical protein
MHQSKNPKTPSGEELVQDPVAGSLPEPPVETVEEADPEKKSTYPVKWEYHRYILRDTAARIDTHHLDALGREGWELVCVFHLHADLNFLFKRFML